MHTKSLALFCILLDYFGIGCYFDNTYQCHGKPLSFVLLGLVLITIFNRARKYGLVISHIYAIAAGYYPMQRLRRITEFRPEVFIEYYISHICLYCI